MCTKTLLRAKILSTFINSQHAAKKWNVFHGAEKMLNLTVSWTVIKHLCREVPSSTKLLFVYPCVSNVIWQNTHFKPLPWQLMVDPSRDHEFKSFFVCNAPRILVLRYLMAAVVPGWSMGSLQKAISGCCHQLSNICLWCHDNCQPCAVTPQSMDTYRHSWNKKSPLQRKGARQHIVFCINVTRDLFLSVIKYL